MAAGRVPRGPGLVDEDEPVRFQIDLTLEPFPALFQDVGTLSPNGMASLFCASCAAARRSGAARQRRRSAQLRSVPGEVPHARCPCASPKWREYPSPVLQPGTSACRPLWPWSRITCLAPLRLPADCRRWRNAKPGRCGTATPPAICHSQEPRTQIHREMVEPSVRASATSTDSESKITIRGNSPPIQVDRERLQLPDEGIEAQNNNIWWLERASGEFFSRITHCSPSQGEHESVFMAAGLNHPGRSVVAPRARPERGRRRVRGQPRRPP